VNVVRQIPFRPGRLLRVGSVSHTCGLLLLLSLCSAPRFYSPQRSFDLGGYPARECLVVVLATFGALVHIGRFVIMVVSGDTVVSSSLYYFGP
jgi:hypothetical protein